MGSRLCGNKGGMGGSQTCAMGRMLVGMGVTPISIFPHRGGRGKRGEDGFPPSRGQAEGRETPHCPAAVGSCFRRNDEKGGGMTRWGWE